MSNKEIRDLIQVLVCTIGIFGNVFTSSCQFAKYAVNKKEKHIILGSIFLTFAIITACALVISMSENKI